MKICSVCGEYPRGPRGGVGMTGSSCLSGSRSRKRASAVRRRLFTSPGDAIPQRIFDPADPAGAGLRRASASR